MRSLAVATCVVFSSMDAVRGELAAVARAVAERHQRRDEPSRQVDHDREHRVEAAAAGLVRIDADRLGRPHLPERRRERQPVSVGGGSHERRSRSGSGISATAITGERKQNMSTPSPVTDGTSVWVMTGTGILKAFDFAGKELWTRDIQKDYGRFGLNWGYGSSPLLYGDSLFVQVLHGMKTDDPSYVLRISKANGRTIWRQERPTSAQHGIARLVHDAGDRAARQRPRARHHRRRRRDRARRQHRQGAVARRRA